jgi:hypothetical protein
MIDHKDRRIRVGLGGFDLYDIRCLSRHMTCCTIGPQKTGIHAVGYFTKIMIGGGVTTLAALRYAAIVSVVVDMGVVAGAAIHVTHPETFAGSQQCRLIAVNVGTVRDGMEREGKMGSRVSRFEPEDRPQLDIIAACMADGAHVYPLPACQ